MIKAGDTAFIVESNRIIREVEVIRCSGGFCMIRFKDSGGGIRVRTSRLYVTREEAEASLPGKSRPASRNPYDFI
jgi:hypothetical protein